MVTPKQQRVLWGLMITIGLVQAGYGVFTEQLFYAAIGLAYALTGAANVWFERDAGAQ